MSFSQKDKTHWRLVLMILFLAIGLWAAPHIASSRVSQPLTEANRGCGGLHAGIRAELVRKDPNYSRPAVVMVSFVLLNDGETQINSTDGGWKLVVDGQELSDSGWIFGNGPQPEGGWEVLRPGESYQFSKELEISRYFPKLGEHTLSWKGQRFQSSIIKITITPV